MPSYLYNGNHYPVILAGSGYVTTRPAAKCLFNESMHLPFLHLEDVFLTGFAAENCAIPRFKIFLGCLGMIRFTDFLAEMLFWELSFFVRNDIIIGFSWEKSFEKCFVYFVTLPKQLTTIKCIQKETEEWVVIFSKTADFLSFYKRNQTTIVTSFYPKSPWNGLFADSLGKLCSGLIQTDFIPLM